MLLAYFVRYDGLSFPLHEIKKTLFDFLSPSRHLLMY